MSKESLRVFYDHPVYILQCIQSSKCSLPPICGISRQKLDVMQRSRDKRTIKAKRFLKTTVTCSDPETER